MIAEKANSVLTRQTNKERKSLMIESINIWKISYTILKEKNILDYNNLFLKIYGIKHDEKINLIDPELFIIPNDDEQSIQE